MQVSTLACRHHSLNGAGATRRALGGVENVGIQLHSRPTQLPRFDDRRDLVAQMRLDPEFVGVFDPLIGQEVVASADCQILARLVGDWLLCMPHLRYLSASRTPTASDLGGLVDTVRKIAELAWAPRRIRRLRHRPNNVVGRRDNADLLESAEPSHRAQEVHVARPADDFDRANVGILEQQHAA
jgi:hypothetical protein